MHMTSRRFYARPGDRLKIVPASASRCTVDKNLQAKYHPGATQIRPGNLSQSRGSSSERSLINLVNVEIGIAEHHMSSRSARAPT